MTPLGFRMNRPEFLMLRQIYQMPIHRWIRNLLRIVSETLLHIVENEIVHICL